MKNLSVLIVSIIILASCSGGNKQPQHRGNKNLFTGAKGEVKIITLNPGHFHTALIQK